MTIFYLKLMVISGLVSFFSLFAIIQSTFYRLIKGQQYFKKKMYEINCDDYYEEMFSHIQSFVIVLKVSGSSICFILIGRCMWYYCQRPLAPEILGQSITVSTRNSKVLNTPQDSETRMFQESCASSRFNYLKRPE